MNDILNKQDLTENDVTEAIYVMLAKLTVDKDNLKSHRLFKSVIKNNVPVWTAIKNVPAVAFFIAESEYTVTKFNSTTKVTVAIYIYNRHDTNSLSSNDILSPLINGVRRGIATLTGPAILGATVTSAKRDGGSIHPYTVAEITAEIEFIEALNCTV